VAGQFLKRLETFLPNSSNYCHSLSYFFLEIQTARSHRSGESSQRKTISVYEIEIRTTQTDQLIALFTGTGFRIK